MREIKFRCWHKKEKRMFIQSAIHSSGLIEEHKVGTPYLTYYGLEEIELMEFTGLTDKHGKDIYEGDILEYHPNSTEILIDVVSFKHGCFCLGKHPFYSTALGYDIHDIIFKIIGNIYENPELLEVKG